MKLGDLVRRKNGGGGHGLIVGFAETDEGQEVLVRWSESALFPNPTRERQGALEVVRPSRGS